MPRKIRIAIFLSGIWVLALGIAAGADYVQILPGQCIFDESPPPHLVEAQGTFFSCDMFSDIPSPWWGRTTFHVGQQVIELNTFRLLFSLLLPLAAIWLLLAVLPKVWRWVTKGP